MVKMINKMLMLSAYAALLLILQPATSSFSHAMDTPCGAPDYDKTTDQGLYLWQNCGTGEWFFRISSGSAPQSNEYRVSGSLQLSHPIQSIVEFEPDNEGQDTLDTSDPENIEFTFRVWGDNQDGFDFKLANNTTACLKIAQPSGTPVVISSNNNTVVMPANIKKLDQSDCVVLTSVLAYCYQTITKAFH